MTNTNFFNLKHQSIQIKREKQEGREGGRGDLDFRHEAALREGCLRGQWGPVGGS